MWTVSPSNPNHLFLDSPCIDWVVQCGDGKVLRGPGLICTIYADRQEIQISVTESLGLSILKK